MSKELKEQVSLADFIADHKKDIMGWAIDQLTDDLTNEMFDDIDFLADMTDTFPGPRSWQLYMDSSGGWGACLVTNVKGEGFPDWDEVIEKAAAKVGVPESLVRAYCTDEFLDGLFWEDVRFTVENIEADEFVPWNGKKFVVVGRSGGYWGVTNESIGDMYSFNYDKLEPMISELLDNFEKYMQAGDFEYRGYAYDREEDYQGRDGEWDQETFVDAVVVALANTVDFGDIAEVSKENMEFFSKLGELIDGTVKDFESSERWVETIEANQYYYEDAAEAGVEEEDDYYEGKKNSPKAFESLKAKRSKS